MADDTDLGGRGLRIEVADRGDVSALLVAPPEPRALLVLAHGAGAGMRHAFMQAVAERLAAHDIATLRYQFPYMEAGGRRTDRPPVAHATVRAAVDTARRELPAVPLFAGGKSFGGRMTSQAAAEEPLTDVRGLIFFGFPLHPPGKPGTERADHLDHVPLPMLFLQGTRDSLANLELLRPVIDRLGNRAALHVVDGGDHSFRVPKRSGRTGEDVMAELGETVAAFIGSPQ